MALNSIAAGALGNALSQGVDTYLRAKQQKTQQDLAQQQMGLMQQNAQSGLLEKGQELGDNGQVQFNPQMQQSKQLQAENLQRQQDSTDPDSDVSEAKRERAKGLLEFYKPGSGKMISDKMSGQEVDEAMPDIEKTMTAKAAFQKANTPIIVAGLKNEQGQTKQNGDLMTKYQGQLNSDTDYKKALGGLAAGNAVEEQLKAMENNPGGSPMSANIAPIALARMATGGQRLNIAEIQALGGSKAVGDRINQAITQASSGNMSPENIDFTRRLLAASKVGDEATRDAAIQRHVNQYAKRTGQNPDDAWEDLTGQPKNPGLVQNGMLPNSQPQAPAAPGAPKPGTIEGGHRFKGGNPADQNNWEPL